MNLYYLEREGYQIQPPETELAVCVLTLTKKVEYIKRLHQYADTVYPQSADSYCHLP